MSNTAAPPERIPVYARPTATSNHRVLRSAARSNETLSRDTLSPSAAPAPAESPPSPHLAPPAATMPLQPQAVYRGQLPNRSEVPPTGRRTRVDPRLRLAQLLNFATHISGTPSQLACVSGETTTTATESKWAKHAELLVQDDIVAYATAAGAGPGAFGEADVAATGAADEWPFPAAWEGFRSFATMLAYMRKRRAEEEKRKAVGALEQVEKKDNDNDNNNNIPAIVDDKDDNDTKNTPTAPLPDPAPTAVPAPVSISVPAPGPASAVSPFPLAVVASPSTPLHSTAAPPHPPPAKPEQTSSTPVGSPSDTHRYGQQEKQKHEQKQKQKQKRADAEGQEEESAMTSDSDSPSQKATQAELGAWYQWWRERHFRTQGRHGSAVDDAEETVLGQRGRLDVRDIAGGAEVAGSYRRWLARHRARCHEER